MCLTIRRALLVLMAAVFASLVQSGLTLATDTPAGEVVKQPNSRYVRIRDQAGNPIAGVTIWKLKHSDASARMIDVASLPPSDEKGMLSLPPLPPGRFDLHLFHPDFAPGELKSVPTEGEAVIDATLDKGVRMVVQIERDADVPAVDTMSLDIRHAPFEHPSTLFGKLPSLRVDGTAELTLARGKYEWFRLKHPQYVVIPTYSQRYGHSLEDPIEPLEIGPGENRFTFHLKRTVKVRGRVIDETSGRPVADQSVEGSVQTGPVDGRFARFVDEWTSVASGETNEQGEYVIELAAGPARIAFEGNGLIARPAQLDLEVAPDGSTIAPDFLVHPMPKVRGVVVNHAGMPVPKAVVRFRGSMLTVGAQPVLTDEEGRFELLPPWIPIDLLTKEARPIQTIVAFHPTQPLDAVAELDLSRTTALENVQLRLEPHEPDSLLTGIRGEMSAWTKGNLDDERQAELAKVSLAGKLAPELDGAHWLNTDGRSMSLADFRGKYVLLQFWATWCGPCHSDMPSLKILNNLYGDEGVVVIGVHDNSMPLEAIEKDVARERLPYPIVVDQADGRIFAQYRAHGMSGYPSYVLVGPDGLVLRDNTTAGPRLRLFMNEIMRQLLLNDNRSR